MAWWEILTVCVFVVWLINTREKAKATEKEAKALRVDLAAIQERLERSGY